MAMVTSLNSGRAKDNVLQSLAREFWFLAAVCDVNIIVTHCPGLSMVRDDLLSRACLSKAHMRRFLDFKSGSSEVELILNDDILRSPLGV